MSHSRLINAHCRPLSLRATSPADTRFIFLERDECSETVKQKFREDIPGTENWFGRENRHTRSSDVKRLAGNSSPIKSITVLENPDIK